VSDIEPLLFAEVVPVPLRVGLVFLCFEVSGKPGHKARHRSRIVFPSDRKQKPFIHNYPEPESEKYEKMISEFAALKMRGRPPTENPVALLVHVFKEIPESWSKREKADARAGLIRPTGRADWDNFGKLVSDALNGVCWKDDAQVVDGRVIKMYSDSPAMRIEVREFIRES